jgi:hypothetical protein
VAPETADLRRTARGDGPALTPWFLFFNPGEKGFDFPPNEEIASGQTRAYPAAAIRFL